MYHKEINYWKNINSLDLKKDSSFSQYSHLQQGVVEEVICKLISTVTQIIFLEIRLLSSVVYVLNWSPLKCFPFENMDQPLIYYMEVRSQIPISFYCKQA